MAEGKKWRLRTVSVSMILEGGHWSWSVYFCNIGTDTISGHCTTQRAYYIKRHLAAMNLSKFTQRSHGRSQARIFLESLKNYEASLFKLDLNRSTVLSCNNILE